MEALLGVGDGLYRFPEYVPEFSGLPAATDYHENSELRVFTPDNVEEIPYVSTHSSPENCPQGCGARLARLPDVKRHIKEQHQCALRRCQDKTFRTRIERDKHEDSHGDEVLRFECGNCGLKGVQKRFVRPEKLKGHFRSLHKTSSDFSFKDFQCLDASCLPDSDGGTFFTSRAELELHTQYKHANKTGGIPSAVDDDYGQ
jgi:hypothetical protein